MSLYQLLKDIADSDLNREERKYEYWQAFHNYKDNYYLRFLNSTINKTLLQYTLGDLAFQHEIGGLTARLTKSQSRMDIYNQDAQELSELTGQAYNELSLENDNLPSEPRYDRLRYVQDKFNKIYKGKDHRIPTYPYNN